MQYTVDYIINVPTIRKIDIILAERAKPRYVGHHEYEESDGEWTLVFIYRTN